jgi:NAD(P)H-hydrate epimerase
MAIDVPFITTAQMRDVDRLMMGEFRISLLQMMESAGRALARLARDRFLDGDSKGKRVLVLVGTGGNGGGGMVCARNLHNWGATVELFGVFGTHEFDPVPAQQLDILDGLGVPLTLVSGAQDLPEADLIIDALVGYSLSGPPRGALASLIRSAADVECPTLALDVPTGVDASTGEVYEPAVKADATMTLALPKTGLAVQGAQAYVGELWLADIGVPPELYAKPTVGVRVRTPFNESDLVKLSD